MGVECSFNRNGDLEWAKAELREIGRQDDGRKSVAETACRARGVKIEHVGPCLHPLPIHAGQAGRVASQDRRLLLVGETFGGTDMIDRMLLPGDGMVAAKHDLTCADRSHGPGEP
jgi:hypothetical protein